MRKIHHHFVEHLRSYRTFNFLFFTFILLITSIVISNFGNTTHAQDILEQAFKPAISNETIINLGTTKNAVGNEVFREGTNVQANFGVGCFVNNQHIKKNDLQVQKDALGYTGELETFCSEILGGDWDTTVLKTEAPLIVRIAKFFLRITMILAVTMVIYNGIMWIIESSRGAEVKDAKKNLTLIVVGILIALMSLGIINLITSITVSSLGTSSRGHTAGCLIDGNVLMGDNLKAYICRNSFYGKWYDDRIGNRCRVNYYLNNSDGDFDDGYRAAITDTEMIDKCIELGGDYKN